MKIVHINTTDTRGGAAQIAYLLHTKLNETEGIESHMLVREKNSDDPSVSLFGVKGWKKWLSILTSHDHTFLGGTEMINHPLIQNADIVHLHNLHGYYFHLPILKELSKTKKIIWTLHDMWVVTGHCGTSFSENPSACGFYPCQSQFEYVPLLLPCSHALGESKKSILKNLPITYVTPSNWLKKKIGKSYLSNKEVLVIQNGFETDIFYNQKNKKEEYRRKIGIEDSAKVVLFVANNFNDPVKDKKMIHKLLLDERLKDVHFIAIGKGTIPYHPHLHRIKYVNKFELPFYYTLSDVFIHPALMDNFPSVVIQSILLGTYVVSFRVGGIPEQIQDGVNGTLINPGNYEMLINALFKAFSFKTTITSKKEFSAERMVEQYIDIYKKS